MFDTDFAMSKRRVIRNEKSKFQKTLKKKYKELVDISPNRMKPELVPLDTPIQRGYKRFFVLRDDVMRSKDVDFFSELLVKINTTQIHHSKKFVTKKRKLSKRIYVLKTQELKHIPIWEWNNNAKYPMSDKERSYFELREVYLKQINRVEKKYVFTQPWRYVLKIAQNLITHAPLLDTLTLQRVAELDNYFTNHNLLPSIRWLTQSYPNRRKSKSKSNVLREEFQKQKLSFHLNSGGVDHH
jgi:hypothetical protein